MTCVISLAKERHRLSMRLYIAPVIISKVYFRVYDNLLLTQSNAFLKKIKIRGWGFIALRCLMRVEAVGMDHK